MYKPIAFSVTICKKYLVELENDEKEGRENEAADSIAPPLKTEGSQEKLTKEFWRSGGGEGRSGGGADYGRLSKKDRRCLRCRTRKSSKARINCSRRWCPKPVLKPYIFW